MSGLRKVAKLCGGISVKAGDKTVHYNSESKVISMSVRIYHLPVDHYLDYCAFYDDMAKGLARRFGLSEAKWEQEGEENMHLVVQMPDTTSDDTIKKMNMVAFVDGARWAKVELSNFVSIPTTRPPNMEATCRRLSQAGVNWIDFGTRRKAYETLKEMAQSQNIQVFISPEEKLKHDVGLVLNAIDNHRQSNGDSSLKENSNERDDKSNHE